MSKITTANGYSLKLDGVSVGVTGVEELARDAYKVGVAAEDLKELTYSLAVPIASLAKNLVVHKSGKLAAQIKPSKSRLKVMVRAGTPNGLPYTGVNHWGRDGHTGPKWLSVAEERMRSKTFDGFGEGIAKLLARYNW